MERLLKEIWDELRSVLAGKTLDAVVPPTVFLLSYRMATIGWGIGLSMLSVLVLGLRRMRNRGDLRYAAAGLAGAAIASGLALLTRDARNYFLGDIAGSSVLLLASLVSLAANRPLAALVSHITRNWPLSWFLREDVLPAYRRVTWLWALFFLGRTALLFLLWRRADIAGLVLVNLYLGWPVTLLVLILSYLYGLWMLHRLGGPGVDEYREDAAPPWRGQKKGF